MAFVMKQSSSYFWPVVIEIPVDGGRFDKQTFDVEFKRITQSRIDEIMSSGNEDELGFKTVAEEIVVGWRGVSDDNGDEFIFSEGNKSMVLDVPMLATAIVKAWIKSLAGAQAKN